MSLSYIFFGTPTVCLPVLDLLVQSGRLPAALVCQPDRPQGRGCKMTAPPTKQWAQDESIPIFQPAKCAQVGFLEELSRLKPDLGLVFAFGQLLPERLLNIPRLGFLNIHPSLLPRYRGAAPVQWTLINGDEQAGVTILNVTPRLDDGDILLQESVPVGPEENAVELGQRLAELGSNLLLQALDILEAGTPTWTQQDADQLVWAPVLTREHGHIDWTGTTLSIHNRIRGVQPWPGASTSCRSKLLKVHRAVPAQAQDDRGLPGQVVLAEGDRLMVRTGDGWLRLLEVQLEGKKRMEARAFLAGRAIAVGDDLGQSRASEK